jgi:hypothetical protein
VFTFSGAGEGGRFECRVDRATFGPCTQSASHRVPDLGLGFHSFEVRAVDSAGNVDGSPASRSWFVIPADDGRIVITTTASWSSVTRKGVKLRRVVVDDAPKGARVKVLCPGHRRCRFAQRVKSRGKRIVLRKFAGKRLAPGQAFAIEVTKRGMIGDYVLRRVKRPGPGPAALARFVKDPIKIVRRCIPDGKKAPKKRCPSVGRP